MKKLITILLLLAFTGSLFAEIGVKSFRKLENDLDARVNEPLKDFSGDISAIIKVVTTETGFTFDCGQVGIVKTVNKPAEIWVYVPYGAKRITISHPKLGQLRDYIFPLPIEKATVYEMILTSGKVITTVDETIESQWLVITPEPTDAAVYIDNVFVKAGTYSAKYKPGSYVYRVEAPLYYTEAGKVEITESKKEINVKLKPAFGYITVTTEPEKDAKVIIDGKTQTNNSPCQSESLASGEHTVQVIKEMYQPTAQKVIVTDGQTTPINLVMQPNFAEVTIISPRKATIYINNQIRTVGNWNGRMNAGIYSIEARLDKHRPAKQDIELKVGDKLTLDLQPTPIYGSLDVISSPIGANITIDGLDYGTTPNTVSELLIGEYIVSLSKMGYENMNKKVNIKDGESTEISDTLQYTKIKWSKTSQIGLNLTNSISNIGQIENENSILGNKTISLSKNTTYNGGQNNTFGKTIKKPLIGDYTQSFGQLAMNKTIKPSSQVDDNKVSINKNNSKTINFNPKEINEESDYITIKTNGLYGCVDKKGNVIIPSTLNYLFVGQFSNDGIAPVIIKYGEGWAQPQVWGIVNIKGEEISNNLNFRYINTFSEGLAWVVLNDKIGCIDRTGKIVIPIIYDQQSCGEGMWCDDIFVNGRKIVSKDGKFGLINKVGIPIIPFLYEEIELFAPKIYKVKSNEKYGLIDLSGEKITNIEFNYIGGLSENRACVKNETKFGYIDGVGKLIIPLKFDFLEDTEQWLHYVDSQFYNGKADVKLNGIKGSIDKDGNFTQNN